ncbi:hypothetical protein G3578_12685 [Brevibacillus sp. SYP-B805]|nr:hypothetical protein [Brevibacillus sp. SYP-B805]NGQ96014.1 hypothetical protein [Brevibacillus sp. SYP-B805]
MSFTMPTVIKQPEGRSVINALLAGLFMGHARLNLNVRAKWEGGEQISHA